MILLVIATCSWMMYKGYCQSYKHQQELLAEAKSRRSARAPVEIEIRPRSVLDGVRKAQPSAPKVTRREAIRAMARMQAMNGKRRAGT